MLNFAVFSKILVRYKRWFNVLTEPEHRTLEKEYVSYWQTTDRHPLRGEGGVASGTVKVEGPKGKLEFAFHPNMKVESDGKQILVKRPDDERLNRALHGLTRALINNMVVGVTKGYEKKLKIEGVGFQAAAKGKGVELTVGFANRILHTPTRIRASPSRFPTRPRSW